MCAGDDRMEDVCERTRLAERERGGERQGETLTDRSIDRSVGCVIDHKLK